MPLIINAEKCEGHDPELMYPMATYMWVLGINPLKTDEDVDKLYNRYIIYQIIHDGMDDHLTLAEFRAYKGAWANTTTMTDSEFNKQVIKWITARANDVVQTDRKAL